MLKTPFRAESMEALYRKVMKGKYPEINKKYSKKFDYVISYMLQLKPENRPNTKQILNIPEIQDKIKELNIFPIESDKMNWNTDINNNRINSGKSSSSNINKSFQSNDQNSISQAQIMNVNHNKLKKNKSGNSIEQSNFETDNNNNKLSNSNILNGSKTPNKLNKSEIIAIINNNLNYFNKKKKEKNKFVLNTIRIPKSLINLNNRLPASQYETDIKNKKIFYGLSFQNNKKLPSINSRYINSIETFNKKENKKGKNRRNIKRNNEMYNSKSVDKIMDENEVQKNNNEKRNIFNIHNRFNTLKMIVDKDKPFNYKGKIDIIVEE